MAGFPLRSQADRAQADNIRSAPESGHYSALSAGSLRATFGLMPATKSASFDVLVGAGDGMQTGHRGQSLDQSTYRQIRGTLSNDFLQ
jgi:hypothetical protein